MSIDNDPKAVIFRLSRDGTKWDAWSTCPDPRRPRPTALLPVSQWGSECGRGFVRDERFAGSSTDRVIPGTNRAKSRKWRSAGFRNTDSAAQSRGLAASPSSGR